jgi:hypothetical protein
MRQIICVLLLGCVAAENVSWMKLEGLDCYIGHGATQIDDYPIGTLPLSACKQACADTPECTGIVVTPQDGQCWRRKDINVSKCSTEFGAQFDTWLKGNATEHGALYHTQLEQAEPTPVRLGKVVHPEPPLPDDWQHHGSSLDTIAFRLSLKQPGLEKLHSIAKRVSDPSTACMASI